MSEQNTAQPAAEVRIVRITTSHGIVIPIQFHQRSYACWHALFPQYMTFDRIQLIGRDYTYTGPAGEAVYASTSLERIMSIAAQWIGETEF